MYIVSGLIYQILVFNCPLLSSTIYVMKIQFNMELLFQLRELVIKYLICSIKALLIFNLRFILWVLGQRTTSVYPY